MLKTFISFDYRCMMLVLSCKVRWKSGLIIGPGVDFSR